MTIYKIVRRYTTYTVEYFDTKGKDHEDFYVSEIDPALPVEYMKNLEYQDKNVQL